MRVKRSLERYLTKLTNKIEEVNVNGTTGNNKGDKPENKQGNALDEKDRNG
jgi:hypothetical protein